ncbi:alpha/beta hydrolase-fold protein [Hyphococcus flavus]|uniref:Alpha/beta hydrolase-fold protein n=1 Tax=Hyphococcus flavus TaxID=1866326 RepID=A0AAE9ZBX6_9PROT|nr:alpha/beta hydrolase-fold protein [Hyphococcus flavus]WDI31456.1 alpha/beta hydrolase-fold protein [Hyphococcus flavus]
MKRISPTIVLFSTFLAASCAGSSQAESANSVSTESSAALAAYEMPRTHVAPIKQSNKDRQYELYIKLPENYSENTDAKYPVIYTTDAVVHMDMLSGSTEFLMPNVILVGISYQKNLGDERANASRFRDYQMAEYTDPEIQARFQGGQVSAHLDFIRNDVIPYIESRYRTIPDERTYFGYSLGGAFGAYILFAEPDTFKHYILGAPAFNPRSLQIVDELEAKTAPHQGEMNVNVFVALGDLERDEDKEAVDHFMSVLQRRSQSDMTLTGLEIIKNSDHAEAFPETAIRGVRWLAAMNSEVISTHDEEN